MMMGFRLGFLLLVTCHIASAVNERNMTAAVIQSINDVSDVVLKEYLEKNKDAFMSFGAKLEKLAEIILDKQVETARATTITGTQSGPTHSPDTVLSLDTLPKVVKSGSLPEPELVKALNGSLARKATAPSKPEENVNQTRLFAHKWGFSPRWT